MSKKIVYDETEFATMKTLLRQIQVIGDQQAAILAMLGQTVRGGKVVEEQKEAVPKRQRKAKQLTEEQKSEKEEK